MHAYLPAWTTLDMQKLWLGDGFITDEACLLPGLPRRRRGPGDIRSPRPEPEASIRLAPPSPSSCPFPDGAAALRGGSSGNASSRGFSMDFAPPSAPPAASTIT
eukprot:2336009-Rhodomonas_salina.2